MNWAVPGGRFAKAVLTRETVPSFQGHLVNLSDGRSVCASRRLACQQGKVVIDENYHKNEKKSTIDREVWRACLHTACCLPSHIETIIDFRMIIASSIVPLVMSCIYVIVIFLFISF